MSLRTPSGALFLNSYGDLWVPDRQGLIYQARLGVSDAQAKRNYADGGLDGVISTGSGSLAHTATGTTFTGATASHKRINTGVVVPAGVPIGMMVLAKKNGAVAILEALDGSNRTGFTLASTTVTYRNNGTTGNPTISWPSDISTKYLCMFGWGDHRDHHRLQIGVGGSKLADGEAGLAGSYKTSTGVGFARSGAAVLEWARDGGGTGSSEAAGANVWAGNRDVLQYAFRLAAYQRVYAALPGLVY